MSENLKDTTLSFKDFMSAYENQSVDTSDGATFDIQEILQQNARQFAGKMSSDTDSSGLRKFSLRVGYSIWNTMRRGVDLDATHIETLSRGGNPKEIIATNIFAGASKYYFNKTNLNYDINRFIDLTLKDGTGYIKMAGTEIDFVPAANILEPAGREILSLPYAERIVMPKSLVQVKYGYDKALSKQIKELADETKGNTITVYEYWFEEEDKVKCQIQIDNKETEDAAIRAKTYNNWSPFIEVETFDSPYKDKFGVTTFPLRKAHMIPCANRRIGFGVFEITRDMEEWATELAHVKRKKDLLELIGVYIFKKGLIGRELGQDQIQSLVQGAMIPLEKDEEIEKMPISYVTNEVIATLNQVFELARQAVGITAMDMGEAPESRVSATAIAEQSAVQQSQYKLIRENIANTFQDFMENLYYPVISKKLTKQENMQIIGTEEELAEMDNILIPKQVYSELHNYKEQNGFYGYNDEQGNAVPVTTQEQIDTEIDTRKQQQPTGYRIGNWTKELEKLLKYDVVVNVADSEIDKQKKVDALKFVVEQEASPAMKRKTIDQIIQLLGGTPMPYTQEDEQFDAQRRAEDIQVAGRMNPEMDVNPEQNPQAIA